MELGQECACVAGVVGVCRGEWVGAFTVTKVVFMFAFVSQQQLAARVSMTRLSVLLSTKSGGLGWPGI